jgi:hypothetical protein
MLVTAFIGTTMSGVAGRPMIEYWEILVPIYALFCMFSGWPHANTNLDAGSALAGMLCCYASALPA